MQEILEELYTALRNRLADKITTFYVGKTSHLATNEMPVLMIFPEVTTLLSERLSTSRDRYNHAVRIVVYINAYEHAKAEGLTPDDVLQAQKAVVELVEGRESDMTPKNTSILGVLRENIVGTDFLYNNDVEITYDSENINGTYFMKAEITLSAVSKYTNRP